MDQSPAFENSATSSSVKGARPTTRSIRKREQDRLAQRASRQRTKRRIAQLEATVTALQGEDAGLLITGLKDQLEQITSQRDRLSDKLAQIEKLARSDDVGTHASTKAPERSPIRVPQLTGVGTIADGDANPDDTIVPYPDAPCACTTFDNPLGPSSRQSIWRSVNAVLKKPHSWSEATLNLEDTTSEDIPVRAILHGWDAIEKHGKLPPLWRKMRGVDELMYINCNDTELAIMCLIHLLLRYHADPNPERRRQLPLWILKRPSQTLPHSYAIDFLVWPGVRERFVFSQHQYCDDQFWAHFIAAFRIAWPFEFRDCYRMNTQTGEFSISPEFYRRIFDIRAWTMSADFFAHFPEMYADIPAFQEVPFPLAAGGLLNRLDGEPQRGRHHRDGVDNQLVPLLGPEAIELEQPEESPSLAYLDYFRIPPYYTIDTTMTEASSTSWQALK